MMDHKAFVFDDGRFALELRSILQNALVAGDCSEIMAFIRRNLDVLRDPYEGAPLGNDWESKIESNDAHQYGDFALTKYYDPAADIGLDSTWLEVQDLLARGPSILESPILGTALGPANDPFDPGKMGSYFQSQEQVQNNVERLTALLDETSSPPVESAHLMVARAAATQSGLYITF